ncbi:MULTISPECIES: hypothetical protein [unclassified Bradyrhizobium]|uniref:hypothetical protein n=1 Tax=unclassified Bradyrhizobium TaxID=2631580 RepID=UPI001FFBAE08|nr:MULTISPECIES: hypothetical protein [unclassified Bradyrhizobium]MCK1611055.1 hypothetical protein [Bradyrhizobium sp. 163]MCK1762809.1 hypothetical protein [Bradyrhizobium sp. 136]
MDWRKELEALRSETAALVSATPATVPEEARAPAPAPQIDDVLSTLDKPGRLAVQPDAFVLPERAHQERFRREREDFFSSTMKRARDLAEGRAADEP